MLALAAGCLAALDGLNVPYRPAQAVGVAVAVEVLGPLGGVRYVPLGGQSPLILDCSLVYSLALAGPFFIEEGLTVAHYSDALHRRFVQGTTRPSKHSYGLAIDVHRWDGPGRTLSVADDYERGLGRGRDCLGRPEAERGRSARLVWCRLIRSELFKLVLDPDFDEGHRDHFHLQALPWQQRDDLEWRLGCVRKCLRVEKPAAGSVAGVDHSSLAPANSSFAPSRRAPRWRFLGPTFEDTP